MDAGSATFWILLGLGLLWLFVLVVALVNIFRRQDLPLVGKLLWVFIILSFPIVGLLIYFILGRRRVSVD